MVLDLSSVGTILSNPLIVVSIVIGFLLWKFLIQPLMNENEPIDPPEIEPESQIFGY